MKTVRYAVLLILAASFALAACKTTPPAARRGDDFVERVYAKLLASDVNGALALFDALNQNDADKSRNLVLKASVLYSAQRFNEAKDAAERALSFSTDSKDSVEAQFVLSNIAALEGRKRDQKVLLEAIIHTDAHFIPALNMLGRLALNNKQIKAAGAYYDDALKADSENMDALMGRAAVYRQERKLKEALRCLNDAAALYPAAAEVFAQRGRVYREMGDLQASLNDLDSAKKLDSADYWIAYDRGRTLLSLGNKREALLEFERAEKINSSIFISYVYSAGIRDDLNDHENAMHDYERLIKLNPDYYFGYEMLGVHYMREKRYNAAKDAFREAHIRAPQEYQYVLLSVINGLYAGESQAKFKPYIEEVMRKVDRSKPEYYMLRLFYDFTGDADVMRRTGAEKDLTVKAKNLFYLANYYGVRGNNTLAQKFFEDFRGLQKKDSTEWRIYEWTIEKLGV